MTLEVTASPRRRAHAAAFVLTGVIVFAADLATKSLVRRSLTPSTEHIDLLPFLTLRHIHNRGVAFGMFSDHPNLVAVAVVAVALVLLLVLRSLPNSDRASVVGIAMIASGAMGNLVDRINRGYVTDFIELPHWPTFNVADIGISCGVALVLVRQWFAAEPHEVEEGGSDAPGS